MIQNNVPYVLIPVMEKEKGIRLVTKPGVNFSYLAFNFKNKYLSDVRVREAIALAIDRERIIKYKLASLASPANSIMNPLHWVYDKNLPQFEYNLEKSKQLLDQTEFKDPDGDGPKTRFTLIYKTSSNKERVEIAQLIAESLKKVGINVIVKSFEFGTFYRDIRQGDFDVYTLTWVGITDPDIYHYVAHTDNFAPKGGNRGYYSNKKLDELMDKSRLQTDRNDLVKTFKEIQKIFFKDFVYAPLWYENNFVFMKDSVHGYRLRPNASYINLYYTHKVRTPDDNQGPLKN